MNKYVIISTNDNEDYFHYLPIVTHAWNQLGWSVICFYRGNETDFPKIKKPNQIIQINESSIYREATIVQISRLFGGCLNFNDDDYLLTSDVDMLPCSDYWKPNFDEISVYGYDLTDYSEYPICYIGMKAKLWREVMNVSKGDNVIQMINSLLDSCPNAKSEDFYEWWGVDQQEITKILKQRAVQHYPRGKSGDYAIGRVDRGNWAVTLNQAQFIDCHLPRPAKNETSINQVQELLNNLNLLPTWYKNYCYE
jgi:hypothetical protein